MNSDGTDDQCSRSCEGRDALVAIGVVCRLLAAMEGLSSIPAIESVRHHTPGCGTEKYRLRLVRTTVEA